MLKDICIGGLGSEQRVNVVRDVNMHTVQVCTCQLHCCCVQGMVNGGPCVVDCCTDITHCCESIHNLNTPEDAWVVSFQRHKTYCQCDIILWSSEWCSPKKERYSMVALRLAPRRSEHSEQHHHVSSRCLFLVTFIFRWWYHHEITIISFLMPLLGNKPCRNDMVKIRILASRRGRFQI